MNIINLMELEPVKASRDLSSYTMLLYGTEKIGKTTLIHELFGERVFFIATEKRHKALAGAYVQYVGSWTEYMTVISQLANPAIREKFDVVAIDTIENLFDMLETYVKAIYNVSEMGSVEWGKDWTKEKELWKDGLKKVEQLGYTPLFIGHSIKKLDRIPLTKARNVKYDEKDVKTDKKTNEKYIEVERYIPDMKPRAMADINKMVDNIIFAEMAVDENGEEVRVLHLRESPNWKAGCTFKTVEPTIELSAEAFKKAIGDSLDAIPEELKTDEKAVSTDNQLGLDFDELMTEAKDIAVKLVGLGKPEVLTTIADRNFGFGNKLTEAQEAQVEPLYTAVLELRKELGKAEMEVK